MDSFGNTLVKKKKKNKYLMNINFKINLTKSQKEAYMAAHDAEAKYLTLVWSRQS